LQFLEAGHAKNSCDRHFGVAKKDFISKDSVENIFDV